MKVIRLKKGEEVISTLETKLKSSRGGIVFGIGALSFAKIKMYNLETKKYSDKSIDGPLELASFTAIISKDDSNTTKLHPHAVVSNSEFCVSGGHLDKAIVGATFEAIVFESDSEIKRYFDSDIGLNLIKD